MKRTLLLISDNSSIRHWVKKHLDEQFFLVEAQTESKAIDTVLTSPLELILLDADLSDCNALFLCKEMKKALRGNLTPILLITGKLKKSFRKEALEAGATDFLSNQLDLEELEMRLAEAKRAKEIRNKTTDLSSAISKRKK